MMLQLFAPPKAQRCRVLYVSPLKALAVDVERNLRAPLAGISQVATKRGDTFLAPAIAVRRLPANRVALLQSPR